jgi:polar amino acid transport system substrate-binding protein
VIQHMGSGKLDLAEVPEPALKSGGVVVRNVASLISAGTERMILDFANKTVIGKAAERPDLVRKVLQKVEKEGVVATLRTVAAGLDRSLALGYSCAGVVEAVGRGAEEFNPGDRVACAGMGYASHADVVFVPRNLAVRIPDGVSMEDASYVTLGAIALQGVRITAPTIGENIVVIGLGLLGQITVQILKAQGCRVIGIDIDPNRVARARELGADVGIARDEDVLGIVARATDQLGADAVMITAATDSNDPIELSAEISRDRARVTIVGAVNMEIPRKPFYMKELELRLSRSYGPGRYDPEYEEGGHDYPAGYVRWTERRNMQEFLRLVAAGSVQPGLLTTHRFPIERAPDAYDIVLGKTKTSFSGIVLEYASTEVRLPLRTVQLRAPASRTAATGIGFIGAGNFASAILLPRFKQRADASLVGVATAQGPTATRAGKRFGFTYATTDTAALLSDASIHAVVIATRHDSHARFAADAMRAGKAVLVEKPLAIDAAGLDLVVNAHISTGAALAVGYNRRFSPLAVELRSKLPSDAPRAMTYRVNAGAIPRESWVHHPEQGGGRIVGEVCHFVDLMQFLSDDVPVEAFAYSVGGSAGSRHDTVGIVLKFRRGSVGTIDYFATGDSRIPKERLEVYCAGVTAILDDFRRLEFAGKGRVQRTKLRSQDKGFDREIDAFLAAVRGGGLPIPLESLVATTRTTFAIDESLRTGRPVPIAAL